MDAMFRTDEGRFKLRVSGIIIHSNKILLEGYDKDRFCLPGGIINLNESSEEAIKRELKEELEKDFLIDKLVSVGEEFYINFKNEKTHSINFYYKVNFVNPLDADTIDLNRLEDDHGFMIKHNLKWIDLGDLNNTNLVPEVIKNDIIANSIKEHYIIEDI